MRELDYLNMSAPTLTIPAHPSTWRRVLGGRDVVIISPQFWGDLWVSKHWIAYQLADYCRVLFVEPPLWLSGLARRPGTWSRDLPKLWQPLREVKKGLLIFRPRLHPRLSSRWTPAVPEQIRGVANRIGMSNHSCVCGRGLPLLEKIVGRVADFLVKKDGTLVAGVSMVERTLTKIPSIQQMQIVQDTRDSIRINLVPGPEYNRAVEQELLKEFVDVFGSDVALDIVLADALDQTAAGKFRFAICNVQRPQD